MHLNGRGKAGREAVAEGVTHDSAVYRVGRHSRVWRRILGNNGGRIPVHKDKVKRGLYREVIITCQDG